MHHRMDNEQLARQLFQEKLGAETSSPPEDTWNGIRQALSAERKKRRLAVLWIAATLLVAAFGGTYFLLAPTHTSSNIPASPTHAAEQQTLRKSEQHKASTYTEKENQHVTDPKTPTLQVPSAQKKTSTWETSSARPPISHHSTTPASNNEAKQYKTRSTEADTQHLLATVQDPTEKEASPTLRLLPILPLSQKNRENPVPTSRKPAAQKPALPFTRWSIEFLVGRGYNYRKADGNFDSNHLNTKDIVTQHSLVKNGLLGIQLGYGINPFLRLETGIQLGKNSFESNWYTKEIEAKTSNENYEFSTIDGKLKIASASLDPYFQTASYDTLNIKIRYQSNYINIPVIARLSLPAFLGSRIRPYLRIGIAYEREFNKTSYLETQRGNLVETIRFIPNQQELRSNLNGILGLGCSTRLFNQLYLNTEFQYSKAFRPKFSGQNLTIRGNYLQFKLGLMYYF